MTTTDIGEIRPVRIDEEMRTSYLDYAMSVIVSRALPDVRDGLKPVQRRILYAMQELGMRPTSSFKKSARLVGEVLGKYHPHGDSPVYEAMVRMAQDFSLRYTLVAGQGNFGSVDGDPPAAMRYTEARLARISDEMLSDIDRETVDWADNFDASLKEPTILPATLPNLLVNGASGIAVGMATNIPPHNLTEVCNAVVHLIAHPDATLDDLMKHVTGPDFPTGAHIWGREGVRNAYATGRGRIVLQATHEFEEVQRGGDRVRIIFTEIPYQVNKATLVAKIADLAKTKKIDGIAEVRDESDRKGMRIVVELRRAAAPNVVLNQLYKSTSLRSAFSANMVALVDRMPQTLTLKAILRHFIDFRREIVTRRAQFDLRKAQARLHILEGLRIAVDNIERVIALIRASADVEEARAALITAFDLSEIQSQAILDMQLRRLAALEQEKIENEYQDLLKLVSELEALLADPTKILGAVRTEMNALKRKFGDERRTEVHEEELGEWRREDTEPHEEVVITLSRAGYVKRIPSSTYRRQHRGGKGVKGQRMSREDDVIPFLQVADTHDVLLFFTNKGRVFNTRVFDLPPDATRASRGTLVQNIINLEAGEKVQALVAASDLLEDAYLVMCTEAGQVKRMHLSMLANLRSSGLNAMNLRPGDSLISVVLAQEPDDIVIVTRNGMSIRFPSTGIRPRQRAAGGMKGIQLAGRDRVAAMDVVPEDSEETRLLIATNKGFGKLSLLRHYRQQKRGGKGLITLKLTTKNGRVAAAQVVEGESNVYLVTEQAKVINIPLDEIRQVGRNTQGVTLAKMDSGDAVSAIRAVGDRREPAAIVDRPVDEFSNGSTNGTVSEASGDEDEAPFAEADGPGDEPAMDEPETTESEEEHGEDRADS
ncbi:MAG: DNA gyrase subunit A [Chloroflexi bacterium]|nr:DNA gyrase subunit A [Chloroflexota bacterium]